jgi:hypothetical protein
MRRNQRARREKRRETAGDQAWAVASDALAIREVYPAEEFAGFENFGESPEWQPGQAAGGTGDAEAGLSKLFQIR